MKLKTILSVTVLACMLSGALNIFAEESETTVNDTDSSIRYSGKWLTQSNSQMYNGDEHYTNTAGSYAEFSFNGYEIRYIGTKSSNRGYFDVYIDGELIASDIDAYSPQLQTQQVLFEKDDLDCEQHIIKIVHTGRRNPASQKAIIGVDAFTCSIVSEYEDPEIETQPPGASDPDPCGPLPDVDVDDGKTPSGPGGTGVIDNGGDGLPAPEDGERPSGHGGTPGSNGPTGPSGPPAGGDGTGSGETVLDPGGPINYNNADGTNASAP